MTSTPTIPENLDITAEDRDVRLKLKPKADRSGFVDGAWWPRSRDLHDEMPTLAARLAIRLGHVERVSYNPNDWSISPRKITVAGRILRLAWYHAQHRATIDVIGATQRLTLLIVAPETPPRAAHAVLLASGHRGNLDTVDTLLSTTTSSSDDDEREQLRWDLDGGPVRPIVDRPAP